MRLSRCQEPKRVLPLPKTQAVNKHIGRPSSDVPIGRNRTRTREQHESRESQRKPSLPATVSYGLDTLFDNILDPIFKCK